MILWDKLILSLHLRVPSYCFSGATLIETKNDKVRIDEIKIGTKLKDGSNVTAVMKMSAKNCKLYIVRRNFSNRKSQSI